MRWLLTLITISFFTIQANAQCATYKLTSKGDTLNCTDKAGNKRGKWKVRVEPLRGNPGYEEEGVFADNRKEGVWRRYNLMGDLIAVQNYKWGNLDGLSQYFTIAGIEREESWKAMNPINAYDTFLVEDVNDENHYEQVILPNDGKSIKHGRWTWYRPGSTGIIRTEMWSLNKLVVPNENKKEEEKNEVKKEEPPKVKPKEVQDFEKKNKGKKTIKVRDGKTG
ncbi:MAG: hypothetical protein LC134_02920 [Chitinophagales bacterium]|nr:hypothetical protein [Chitinophagaceae bacterium]MCZ2298412.1 hypothetical protein [Chitinophagales bacterium]